MHSLLCYTLSYMRFKEFTILFLLQRNIVEEGERVVFSGVYTFGSLVLSYHETAQYHMSHKDKNCARSLELAEVWSCKRVA